MSPAYLSLKRPVTAVMFYVSLMVVGLIAAFRLPLEQFPDVNLPFLVVDLPYPGSTPQEVERTIARPAEEALATLPGIQRLNSVSRDNGASVFVQFSDLDRDIEITASEARDKLDAIRSELPSDFQRYFVLKFSPSDQPLMRVRFASDRDLRGEYFLIQRVFQRRLERLPGVARVDITGAPPPEVEIAIDPSRIAAHNISLNELALKLQAVNFSVSAGSIDTGERRLRVQPVGELRDLDELRRLVLDDRGLRLGDIADVRLKLQRQDVARRLEGRPAVGIDVYRETNANLIEVSRAISAELEQIKQDPDLAGIEILIFGDQAESVSSSIDELIEAGVLGALLSLLILYYFLRHWPSTLMVTLAIPICIVMTLGVMYFGGMSLNVLTMMGLLLGIGMLVDNAVVVVESIYQYREKYPNDPMRCALEGTRSVQLAISAGTLTSIIVFIPNLFGAKNLVSIYLGQVAITITIALLASWLVAVSLIPMISARLRTPPAMVAEHGFLPALSRAYGRLLRWSLAHRGKSLLAIILIVAVSLVPFKFMTFDMFPDGGGREIEMSLEWRGAYSLEQMSDEVARVERFLDENREKYQITQIYSYYGERGFGGVNLELEDEGKTCGSLLGTVQSWFGRDGKGCLIPSQQVVEALRKDLPKLARAEIRFQGGGGPPGGGGGTTGGMQVFLTGDSNEVLEALALDVLPRFKGRDVLRDVRIDVGDQSSEVRVSVNRDRAAALGFSAREVADYIGIALRGSPLREFRTDDGEIPVWVRFAGAESIGIENLSGLTLRRADGTSVPLLSLVDVDIERGASQISRQNRRTSLAIAANVAPGSTLEDARKTFQEVMRDVSLPPGYAWSFGQSFDTSDEAGQQMGFNTLIALLMIFIVMAALFESMLFPVAIMSGVLFSALGVFWLFALTGTTFSIMASIGILVLMGVVVNNGIVMIEHINNRRREGLDRTEALVEGARERLRPILMTMGTTVLGMLPLCFGGTQIGGGGPPYYPMARAIVGGLVFSTVVSLLFLPTIYALLDDMRTATAAWLVRVRSSAPLGGRAREGA
ncbi:MAG: efflux RND transporter permease subunit [Xanthomonadaceae bacterium]|jgi:HAE1 family hydrophobic/amphiphilic exporter-1|nr:efflux RND transporter permease subunit [Xanthomonadaceae bacterium]